jgi:microcystin-dependent protein
MSSFFIGELRCFGFNFAPVEWALCNGQLLPIAQNPALFNLIGTTYGGDGNSTFALPNLQSRVPIHQGNSFVMGAVGGAETVTITSQTMPAHFHSIAATTNTATLKRPVGGTVYAASSGGNTYYATPNSITALNPTTVTNSGGNLPHPNLQPYLTLNWCIALTGIFPSS